MSIRPITAAQARPVRQAVLRPGLPPKTTLYAGDDAPDSFHAGAFVDERLVGIATLHHKPPPGEADAHAWQLRGMAVLPEQQGRGLGRGLVLACRVWTMARGGTRLWCNGRVSALGFYQSLGFQPRGEIFDSPHSGPHYQLVLALQLNPGAA
ncbi:MAG: GNAT family N-acetyltransferase [Anaerolineales bacterium]